MGRARQGADAHIGGLRETHRRRLMGFAQSAAIRIDARDSSTHPTAHADAKSDVGSLRLRICA
jgi:hypothetical protein